MAATRRDPMLAAGEDLFLRRGFAAVGLRELLDTVGASKGAFYHFFPSKEAFASSVLERQAARRAEEMQGAIAGGALAQVVAWFRHDLDAQVAAGFVPRCLASRLAVDLGAGMPAGPVRDALRLLESVLAEALAQGQRAGAIYDGFEPRAAARHLLDLWRGATTRAAADQDDAAPRAALDHMAVWLKP